MTAIASTSIHNNEWGDPQLKKVPIPTKEKSMKSCEELYATVLPLIERGEYSTAINEMETLLHAYPDFAQGHYDMGSLCLATGDKQRAMQEYRLAVDLDPRNTAFLKSLADYYYAEQDDIGKAKTLYHRVVEEIPEDVECLQILGNLAVVERDFEAARDLFQKVLDIEPWNHDALMIYEKLEQQPIKSSDKQASDATYAHSQRLVEAGKTDEAIQTLEALIKDQTEFASAYNDLGVLYYQSGQKEKTLGYYEKAVQLEPDQLNFQKNLADFYFVELGRVEDALEIYCRVLRAKPTDIETLMAAGFISRALNRNDAAITFFERVLDIEPWNFEANDNLDQLNPVQIDSL
jgi:tetratricopeptide (TPR) repeat protein